MKNKYYLMDVSDVLNEFKTNINEGLSNEEVLKRQNKYGYNVLPKKEGKSIFKIFYEGILDPIIILLLFTIILSFIIGEYVDGIVIFFIVILDLILGTISEYQANKNALGLMNLIHYDTMTIRNRIKKRVDSTNLVPGDIVFLESGDKITCDMRVISSENLEVDESILTGESVSVFKKSDKLLEDVSISERNNMLYAGTTITKGRGVCVIVGTGINTELGNIAKGVTEIKEEKSPLMIRISKLSKQITILIIIVAFIIFITLLLKGYHFTEIFMSVVALSVSAMPEGLPLALTMALTITSSKMIKNNVIVKKLYFVEALGSCSVIATDKTGTLTVNEQTAKVILLPNGNNYEISGVGYKNNGEILKLDLENKGLVDKMILNAKLNNEAIKDKKNCYYGDSIDIAFNILSEKANIYSDEYMELKRIPYESENKYSALFYRYKDNNYCTVKGSIDVILSFCDVMDVNGKKVPIDKELLNMQNDQLAENGYRVIAIASRRIGKIEEKDKYDNSDIPKLCFLGMVGFIDPIRNDVTPAISKCHSSGIKVLMITGDHPKTAFKIAQELNIANNYHEVVTGKELEDIKSDRELDKLIRQKTVFARVSPSDKLRIVESIKRGGDFVAVTGDGVNDALALRSANIGISMGSGTDTAKEVSNMIIVDDNFKSIVSGIELGRGAYSNIRKVCFFLLSCGLAEVLFFLLSIIFNLPMPLVAIELLWLNLVTDGFQDLALSYEKEDEMIMKKPPIPRNENIFNKKLFSEIMVSGLFIGLLIFLVWYHLINNLHMNVSLARGYIMALMVFIQNIHVFNCRNEDKSAFLVPLKNNPFIIFTVILSILLQIIVMEVPILSSFLKTEPIPYQHMLVLFIMALSVLIVMEIFKLIRKKLDISSK